MKKRFVRSGAVVVSGIAAIIVAAGPRVDIDRAGPQVAYPVAHANEPGGGAGNDPETMKKLCGLLGVGAAVIEQAPKTCGVNKPGDLTPTAVVCATAKGDNLATGGFRVCETCAAQEARPPCEKEVKAKAKIDANFRVIVYGFTVECKAGATYEASASSTVSFQNTAWTPNANATGKDGAVTYYSNILTVAASTKAAIQLGGDCTVTPPVGKGGGGGASLDISCEVTTKGNVFALTATRNELTCGKKDEPDAAIADAATTDAAPADAAPADAAPADAATKDAAPAKQPMGM